MKPLDQLIVRKRARSEGAPHALLDIEEESVEGDILGVKVEESQD